MPACWQDASRGANRRRLRPRCSRPPAACGSALREKIPCCFVRPKAEASTQRPAARPCRSGTGLARLRSRRRWRLAAPRASAGFPRGFGSAAAKAAWRSRVVVATTRWPQWCPPPLRNRFVLPARRQPNSGEQPSTVFFMETPFLLSSSRRVPSAVDRRGLNRNRDLAAPSALRPRFATAQFPAQCRGHHIDRRTSTKSDSFVVGHVLAQGLAGTLAFAGIFLRAGTLAALWPPTTSLIWQSFTTHTKERTFAASHQQGVRRGPPNATTFRGKNQQIPLCRGFAKRRVDAGADFSDSNPWRDAR